MVITSIENPKIKKYLKLKTRKYMKKEELFIVEGEHLVLEALKNNLLVDLLVLEDYQYNIDFPCTFVSYNILKLLSSMESVPKVIGIVKFFNKKEILGNKIILLDDIGDPGNLGTIIRSSVAFGITDIVLSPNTVDIYNDKVIRASQGMIFNINVLRCDLKDVITSLKDKGYLVLGTDVSRGVDVRSIKTDKYAIVMGNEGMGVKEEILKQCDKNLYIKMNEHCESLNVGVAASIIMYELNR